MTKKQKKMLWRIFASFILIAGITFIPVEGIIFLGRDLKFWLFFIPYFVIGYDILFKALKGIINLQGGVISAVDTDNECCVYRDFRVQNGAA